MSFLLSCVWAVGAFLCWGSSQIEITLRGKPLKFMVMRKTLKADDVKWNTLLYTSRRRLLMQRVKAVLLQAFFLNVCLQSGLSGGNKAAAATVAELPPHRNSPKLLNESVNNESSYTGFLNLNHQKVAFSFQAVHKVFKGKRRDVWIFPNLRKAVSVIPSSKEVFSLKIISICSNMYLLVYGNVPGLPCCPTWIYGIHNRNLCVEQTVMTWA